MENFSKPLDYTEAYRTMESLLKRQIAQILENKVFHFGSIGEISHRLNLIQNLMKMRDLSDRELGRENNE